MICFKCSEMHRALEASISTVKCLNSDDWNEFEISHLEAGGNEAFDQLIKKYSLPEVPALVKYKTKAAQHYRLQLESIANKTIFEDSAPSLEEGKLPCIITAEYFISV